MKRRVKIVATVGPACESETLLSALMGAGMDVARLNFSHGSYVTHGSMFNTLRKVAEEKNHPLTILQDLQGPKIRIGNIPSPISIQEGETYFFHPEGDLGIHREANSIPVDFPDIFPIVKSRDLLLLDDGRIKLQITSKSVGKISAKALTGGVLSSNKGINLPGIQLDIPAVTEKDVEDLKFGLSLGVDVIALSFVQKASDVTYVREIIDASQGKKPLVIAKLERPVAIDNLNSILDVVDGVMVARGDLGVEMPPESVPSIQKKIIREANRNGKIVITATQMLESMIYANLPTRAEASDVANAVYDGTDAVMLSAETAIGKYPVESVIMMDRIIREAEHNYDYWGRVQDSMLDEHDDSVAIVRAARELAHDRDVEAIAVFTRSGRTAFLMSKARPCVPILAFTPDHDTYKKLGMVWGVFPNLVPWSDTVEDMISHVEKAILKIGVISEGGQIILVSGFPVRDARNPNMALLHSVGK